MALVIYAEYIPGKYKYQLLDLTGEGFRGSVIPVELEVDAERRGELFELLSHIAEEYDSELYAYETHTRGGGAAKERAMAYQIAVDVLEEDDQPSDLCFAGAAELKHCWVFVFEASPSSHNSIGILVDKQSGKAFFRRYVDVRDLLDDQEQ
ncbi:hypothetical protein FIV42_15960 [Persicimonas caeni]|uniref:Uncharacterized protein n=1 Tax=Persicimonas caeni TaxID=2292766 RepID=A0A4Y6PVA6_PERCE|nr:hypothetical protein [Persicimonas caeni]QDG52180.1 hypothetical protein FIV42_15960 [Persicimonas caeni]QED33402.1 hypothetical protein FRD00_15955 [Persicimonas caeni]